MRSVGFSFVSFFGLISHISLISHLSFLILISLISSLSSLFNRRTTKPVITRVSPRRRWRLCASKCIATWHGGLCRQTNTVCIISIMWAYFCVCMFYLCARMTTWRHAAAEGFSPTSLRAHWIGPESWGWWKEGSVIAWDDAPTGSDQSSTESRGECLALFTRGECYVKGLFLVSNFGILFQILWQISKLVHFQQSPVCFGFINFIASSHFLTDFYILWSHILVSCGIGDFCRISQLLSKSFV